MVYCYHSISKLLFSGESFIWNEIFYAAKITQNIVNDLPYAIKGARCTSCRWHKVSTVKCRWPYCDAKTRRAFDFKSVVSLVIKNVWQNTVNFGVSQRPLLLYDRRFRAIYLFKENNNFDQNLHRRSAQMIFVRKRFVYKFFVICLFSITIQL